MTVRACHQHLSPMRQRGEPRPRHNQPSARTVGLRLVAVALSAWFIGWAVARAQVAAARPQWTDEMFDQWVFQQDRNVSGARQRLDSLLALRVEDVDRACSLTDAQRTKLQLAGRGDIKRFFDRYETIKQKFQSLRNDDQKMQEIWQDISPLQMSLQAGLFHEDSLLVKALRNTLSREQFTVYNTMDRERRSYHHRVAIEGAVAMLEQTMPLRDAQRRELIALLTNHMKPPRKPGQYEFQLVMYRLSCLPQAALKPLFDNAQWKVVSQQLDQYKQWDRFLRQSGQLLDEDDDGDRQPAAMKK